MKSTMNTKPAHERTLPKRDPKTGRFEKSSSRISKPAVNKTGKKGY